jgi:signal transduction histidine kinase
MKILIVEDEVIVAMDLKVTLVSMDHNVIGIANDFDSALYLIEKEKPELILMDINISGNIDGIETAEHVNERFKVPVVFLTAYSNPSVLKRIKKVVAYGYLLKPFNDQELKTVISIAFDKFTYEKKLEELNSILAAKVNSRTKELQNLNEYLSIEIELRNKIEEELILKNLKLKEIEKNKYSSIISATERERKRIAMELHDGIGQKLTSAKLTLGAILKMDDSLVEKDNVLIRETKLIIEETMRDARGISQNLIPNVASKEEYLGSMKKMMDRYKLRNDFEVIFECSVNFDEIDSDRKLSLFRIIQEGLNNIVKHAKASMVNININVNKGRLELLVVDNGIGFDEKARLNSGNGLTNMEKRCEIHSGKFSINSKFNIGTRIEAFI